MTTEIIEHKELTLSQITETFSSAQRYYLKLLVIGFRVKQAMEMAGRKKATVRVWRAQNPQFKEAEAFLSDNSNLYRKEALESLSQPEQDSVRLGLIHLANRIHQWDTIPEKQKTLILRAAEIVDKMRSPDSSQEGYEEMLLRIRRKNATH